MKKIKTVLIALIRIAFIILGAGFLYTFICPMFMGIINIGNILGVVLSTSVFLVGVFLKKIIAFCCKQWKNQKAQVVLCVGFSILTIGICCFGTVLGSVIYAGNTGTSQESTIIVLGCAVKGDTPSYTLNARINAAYDYLCENPDSVAVLSGGQESGENISEAQCMYDILAEKGIDTHRLFLEDKSTNTYENIVFSKKVIDDNGLSKNAAVVTSDYHLKRALMVMEKNGFDNPGRISSPSTFFDKSTFYLREVLAVVKEFITQ